MSNVRRFMHTPAITNLWISAEHWPEEQWTPADAIVDIKATLHDGTSWVVTVCTFAHVNTLTSQWAKSGECLNGQYLWAANLILATSTSRSAIEAALEDL